MTFILKYLFKIFILFLYINIDLNTLEATTFIASSQWSSAVVRCVGLELNGYEFPITFKH